MKFSYSLIIFLVSCPSLRGSTGWQRGWGPCEWTASPFPTVRGLESAVSSPVGFGASPSRNWILCVLAENLASGYSSSCCVLLLLLLLLNTFKTRLKSARRRMRLRPIVGQPGNSSIISRVKLGQTTVQLRKRAGFDVVGHRQRNVSAFSSPAVTTTQWRKTNDATYGLNPQGSRSKFQEAIWKNNKKC